MSGNTVFTSGFFSDPGFDFETRIALGHIACGAADAGEIFATIALINDGDDASWVAAWSALGDRLTAAAEVSDAAGHTVSAASAYLRAAVAYGMTLNTLAGAESTDGLLPMFRKHRDAWSHSCALRTPAWEPVRIPYEGSTLPGWFAACDASSEQRPTLILNNGSDGAISSMVMFGGAGALARGYNVLFFDGPGQQSQLFEHNLFFRPDWEAVISPVVDFLCARSDVDPAAIALYGVSQAGYWVPRAVAFEHRIAAAIADTGVVDVSQSWLRHLPKEMTDLLESGDRETFNAMMAEGLSADPEAAAQWHFRARPYGFPNDPYSTYAAVRQYRLDAADAARITTPLLITDPEGEHFFPGQSEQLAAMTPDVSRLVRFTAAEGASFHCEPMARLLVDQRMFDWLDRQLGR